MLWLLFNQTASLGLGRNERNTLLGIFAEIDTRMSFKTLSTCLHLKKDTNAYTPMLNYDTYAVLYCRFFHSSSRKKNLRRQSDSSGNQRIHVKTKESAVVSPTSKI